MLIHAIVPAAGLSVRMGRPKLTLPLGNKSVVALVVDALHEGGVNRVLCVVRPLENPEADRLVREARESGAEVAVCSPPPPDMRASVEYGITILANEATPPAGILLCPGDSPGITRSLVRRVIDEFTNDPTMIVLPRGSEGKRGHPVAIPWDLALTIRDLPPESGVNILHTLHEPRRTFLPIADGAATFADLDTPQDYKAWKERLGATRERP
jgi:molybdenum cofactor cytidylyltransferase